MADTPSTPESTTGATASAPPSVPIGEVIELVTNYAKQETLAPVRGAGRWVAYGIAGAICLGTGATMLVLGLLRLIQNEFGPTFAGRWMSLLPYVAALLLCVVVIGIAVSRIAKTSLQRD
ncbi:MAG: hypothetical protein F2534_05710 [Actinobacteria bacterium]|uniref:Unannotated protein n=1 Tax=freshwater metagenome TaxID=449393 RepID=A0A6J6CHX4_9ZZZZ|nr:hypothetical protein [Actinomycetota bacterium]